MRYRLDFCSVVLISIMCMFGDSAFAASSVRVLGTNGGDVATGSNMDAGAKNEVKTSAVTQNTRASSLRFSPTATSNNNSSTNTVSQSYSGLVAKNGNTTSSNIVNNSAGASSRLSVGKYLNLSHSTRVTPSNGSGTSSGGNGVPSSGGTSGSDISTLRIELDRVKDQVDRLKEDKQNTLIVGNGDYIDITGSDNNIISIDIEALKEDLRIALGTDKDILTEIDDDYKLWWCYANEAGNACVNEMQLVVDLGEVLDTYPIAENNVNLKQVLAGKQGILTEAENGFITINQRAGTVGVKFNELKEALGIESNRTSEIQFDPDGKLKWRYIDEFESDGTKKWNVADITALITSSLNNYVQVQVLENYVLKSELGDLQGDLTEAENGYIKIENNQIGVRFSELKEALNIPDAASRIEMEITSDGKLRWRYENEFESNGEKKWTIVSKDLGEIIDGKLENYVSNTTLNETLNNYITNTILGQTLNSYVDNSTLSTVLQDYATTTYINNSLENKQVKLTEAENGFVEIKSVDGGGETIGIKFNDLKEALHIDKFRTSEMRVIDGVLQWRYTDEFESDGETKKWTTVYDLKELLDGYVKQSDFERVISEINTELAGKQIKLTPTEDGFILLNELGEIAVDMESLRDYLALEGDGARTAQIRVLNGKLEWRYIDEYFEDDGGNREELWHSLDLDSVNLTTYAKKSYVTNNYYNRTYIDNLAQTIENNINVTLNKLSLPDDGPDDQGIYVLKVVKESGQDKVSSWRAVHIVDGAGVIH